MILESGARVVLRYGAASLVQQAVVVASPRIKFSVMPFAIMKADGGVRAGTRKMGEPTLEKRQNAGMYLVQAPSVLEGATLLWCLVVGGFARVDFAPFFQPCESELPTFAAFLLVLVRILSPWPAGSASVDHDQFSEHPMTVGNDAKCKCQVQKERTQSPSIRALSIDSKAASDGVERHEWEEKQYTPGSARGQRRSGFRTDGRLWQSDH